MEKFKEYLQEKSSSETNRMLKAINETFDSDGDFVEEIFHYIKSNDNMTLAEMVLDLYHSRVEAED